MHGSDMLVQWVWLESDIQVRPEEIFLCLFDHPSNRFRAALHWGRPLPNTGSYSWQVDSTFEENDVCQCVYLALFIRNPFDQSEASRRSTAGAALQRRDRPDDQLTRALVVEKTARKERRATILSASEEESASDSSGDEDGDYKDDKHEGNAERRHLLRSQRRAPSQSRRCSARRKDAIPLFDRAVCHSHAFFIIRPTALAELELMYAAFCRAHQLEMEHLSEERLRAHGLTLQARPLRICPDLRPALVFESKHKAIQCPGQGLISTQSKLVRLEEEEFASCGAQVAEAEQKVVVYK
eukprot:GHVT01039492.1.p2 GENE.GHVT01039492.1~~GHVT01039492.1.p2  ORF type:complete len:297 (-),score=33.98 GHVT01039492.1:672-1562(-)